MSRAEIVSFDAGGRHNADLARSTARIIEGGSWKTQRVIVLMPAAQMMATKVALSHMCLYFPPNNGVHRMLCLGMEVGDAYSQAIEQILAHPDLGQWEYLLTIEHDNCPPPDGVVKLVDQMERHPEYACIGGLYWTKGEGGVPQIWGDPTDPVLNFRPQPPRAGELVECCGTGQGFNLFRLSMFRDDRLRKPWFQTINGLNGPGMATQDLHFWGDARKYGYRAAIDCSVLVGHWDQANEVMW